MHKEKFWHKISVALLFFVLAVLPGCQGQDEKEALASPPAAPTAESVARQSAPVPQGQALEILLLNPSGNIKKLTQIVAMFNQPMVALGNYDQVAEGAMKIEPPQEGTFKWLNQYTLAFIPKEPLEGSLDLRAEVPAGLTALSGAVLATGQSVEISLPRLAVIDSHWGAGYYALDEARALKPSHTVYLNQKVDLESLKAKAFFSYKNGDNEVTIAADISAEAEPGNIYTGDGEYSRAYGYTFTPRESLPKNTGYQIILEEGVRSLSGPLPSPRLVALEDSTFGPLRASVDHDIRGQQSSPAHPAYGIYLYFSNPVKISEAIKLVNIDNGYDLGPLRKEYADKKAALPEGEEDAEDYQRTLYIPGGFLPETLYTVTLDEGLTDVFGQKLGQRLNLQFRTGQYNTSIRLDENHALMETGTEPKAPLVLSNIESATVRGYALGAEDAVRFVALYGLHPNTYADSYEGILAGMGQKPVAEQTITPPNGAKNGPVLMPVDLAAMFGDQLKGKLLFLFSSWQDRDREGQPKFDREGKPQISRTMAFIQMSDIGLTVKTGLDGGLAWTTNLAEGHSWPGVDLALYGPDGQVLWQGQSDENGLCRLPNSTELLRKTDWDDDIFMVASAAGQTSLWGIAWDDGLEAWRYDVSSISPLRNTFQRRPWLLSALPLYKPGETAEFKVIAREKQGEVLADWAGQNMILRVKSAGGQVVEEARVTGNAYGTFSHTMKIPQNAHLGEWSVNISREGVDENILAGYFKVMAYRAPAFDITVDELPKNIIAGDSLNLGMTAAYHFGSPVVDQPASYEVVSSPAYYFALPGLGDYSFVNTFESADDYDDSGEGYHEPTKTVSSDSKPLDREGRLVINLNLTPEAGQKPRPRSYGAYFTVTDVDQREVSTYASFMLHPAEHYVGLRNEKFMGRAGEPFALKALVADLAGNYVPGRTIKSTLYRRDWQSVRRKTPGNAYEYVSRVVDEEVAKVEAQSGEAPVDLTFTPDKAGYYWVLAEIEDEKGRKNQSSESFYVSGEGPVGWQMHNDDRLTLVTDKKEYKAGDTARILVQSPFAEGEGLLTVERAGVREARVFKIENQSPTLEVPITEADEPNVFVSVLLSRGRIAERPDENGVDLGKPAIRLGYVELKVPTTRDLLTVEVTPSQKEVGPGGEVEVTLSVKDNQGRPFSEAEVALIAADAAVIQLAGDAGYYPDRHYQQDEYLAVMTANNILNLVGRRQWGLKGANPGGGGALAMQNAGEAANVRRLFKSLAYFNPSLTLNAEGQASATIKMPENLTTFKLYAVATGHGRKSGTGFSEVLVTRDLLVRSALPGYAGVGDSFSAAMVLTNRAKNSGEAKVVLSGSNFTLAEGETAEKTVSIKPGESREVPFMVSTAKSGQARFLFSLSMGDESDAAEYVIDVIPPNKLLTQASYEQILPGEKRVHLARPGGLDPERGGLELTLSPSLLGTLSEPFQWLAEYPHRCLEQMTSRAWGSLLTLELKNYLPDGHNKEKLDAARRHVTEHLGLLAAWEMNGGYTLWPYDRNWNSRSVFLTAYVFDFILSAKQMGFYIGEDRVEENIREFLLSALSSDYQWPEWYSVKARNEARTYTLSVLSRAGVNVAAYLESIYQERESLRLVQLVNLIRAVGYQPKGNVRSEQLLALLPLLNKHLTLTAGEAQFVDNDPGAPELWASPARNSARILETLCLVAPHNNLVPPLMRHLMNQTKNSGGHFGGTQDNVAGLLAMAAYAKALEPENPDISIKALLGETVLASADFHSFTAPPAIGEQPMAAVAEGGSALVYRAEGSGQAWASLKMKSAPLEPDLSADTNGGFMLSRSFAVLQGDKAQEGSEVFRRGDLVRVSVLMMAPVPRYNVVLEDRVPAGFEPINFNLNDADMTLLGLINDEEAEGRRYWYNHQEIRPDRVNVYADYLSPGVYTFSYLARAITPGSYITPGPVAEEMYAPETYGRGQGQILRVE